MKKWLLILLLFFAIIIIAVGITIYQGMQVLTIVQDETTKTDLEAFLKGDCSKMRNVDEKIIEVKAKLSIACKNPLLKAIIYRQAEGVDLCTELKNPDNKLEKSINNMKENCTKGV